MLEVRKLTDETVSLLWSVDGRRVEGEKIRLRFKSGGFALEYSPLPEALWRTVEPDERLRTGNWLDREDAIAFLAWYEGKLAGQVLIEIGSDGFANIRDIRVDPSLRRKTVGSAMLELAEEWAERKKTVGVCVETADTNAGICQFLTSRGYELGGVDALRYAARAPGALNAAALREWALYFYKFFR